MSKTAEKLVREILRHGVYTVPDSKRTLENIIDRALEGKIISKSEVESLRRENLKLTQENADLLAKIQNPIYIGIDWAKGWQPKDLVFPSPFQIGQYSDYAELGSLPGERLKWFERFLRRLKFWQS